MSAPSVAFELMLEDGSTVSLDVAPDALGYHVVRDCTGLERTINAADPWTAVAGVARSMRLPSPLAVIRRLRAAPEEVAAARAGIRVTPRGWCHYCHVAVDLDVVGRAVSHPLDGGECPGSDCEGLRAPPSGPPPCASSAPFIPDDIRGADAAPDELGDRVLRGLAELPDDAQIQVAALSVRRGDPVGALLWLARSLLGEREILRRIGASLVAQRGVPEPILVPITEDPFAPLARDDLRRVDEQFLRKVLGMRQEPADLECLDAITPRLPAAHESDPDVR